MPVQHPKTSSAALLRLATVALHALLPKKRYIDTYKQVKPEDHIKQVVKVIQTKTRVS